MEEIRSDLSVYHRIDDLEGMEARRFLSFAQRLHHYQGAVRGYWVDRLSRKDDPAPFPTASVAPTTLKAARQEVPQRVALNAITLRGHEFFTGQFGGNFYSQTSELPPVPVTNPHRDPSSAST